MRRLILLTAILSTTLLAQGPGPRRTFAPGAGAGEARQPRLTALKDYLNLTDTQVTALTEARKRTAEANKAAFEEMRTKAQALRTEMQKDSPDAATVGNLQVELKKLREQTRDKRNAVDANAFAVLTPEQQAKLKALEEARKLFPAAGQADALGLIAAPERPEGAPGPALRPRMRGPRVGAGMRPGMGPQARPGMRPMRGGGPGPAAWMEREPGEAPPPPADAGEGAREF